MEEKGRRGEKEEERGGGGEEGEQKVVVFWVHLITNFSEQKKVQHFVSKSKILSLKGAQA